MKQAFQNSATNMKVSIFILYGINLICTKRLVLPVLLCLSDASLIIADNCIALCLIPPPAVRSVSAWLISYVNYRDTCCKVSYLSLFVTQFRSSVRRYPKFLFQKVSPEIFRHTRPMSPSRPVWS